MRGILQTQTVADQAKFARLADQILKHLGEALLADALAEVGTVGVMGDLIMDAQTQEPSKCHVGADALKDGSIGSTAIMIAQEKDLEHADRIDGWTTHYPTISVLKPGAKLLEVNLLRDATQIMILRHNRIEKVRFRKR